MEVTAFDHWLRWRNEDPKWSKCRLTSPLHFPPAVKRHSCQGSGGPAGMAGIVSLLRKPQTRGSYSSTDLGGAGEGRKGRIRVKRCPTRSRLGKLSSKDFPASLRKRFCQRCLQEIFAQGLRCGPRRAAFVCQACLAKPL